MEGRRLKRDNDRNASVAPSPAEIADVFAQLTPKQQELLRHLHKAGMLKPLLEDLKRNIELAQAKPTGEA